jgi:hypothetical protein
MKSTLRRRSTRVALALLIGATVVLFPLRIVWEVPTGADLFWSGSEAYLVVGSRRTSWAGNLVGYGWQIGRNFFRLGAEADVLKEWVTIVHLTETGAKSTTLPGRKFGHFTILENRLQGVQGGRTELWMGEHFEALPPPSQPNLPPGGAEPDAGAGWSTLRGILHQGKPERSIPVVIEGARFEFIVTDRPGAEGFTAVDLIPPGGGPQRLIHLVKGPRRVSAEELAELSK